MTPPPVFRSLLIVCRVTLVLFCLATPLLSADVPQTVAGRTPGEAFRLGEAMYQDGIHPNGKPLTAIVQGDIELTGTMSTCSSCHLRSGLGSLEGGILSPPTNGIKLYNPLKGMFDIPGSFMKRSMFKTPRPAYTDETLVAALVNGTGPSGKKLDDAMPRYLLDDEAAKILVHYLRNLTSSLSPGVTDSEIRFATIVGEGVSAGDRAAMLTPLTTYIRDEWNGRLSTLLPQQIARLYGFGKVPSEKLYRKISLDVWELKGRPETWGEQLEKFYREKPVFAILGGIAHGNWAPVHNFCEKNRIPGVLPITDLPVVSGSDRYTLYFSKGYFQEGDAASKYLSRVLELSQDRQVVQVYRESAEGRALVDGFTEAWNKLGSAALISKVVPAEVKTGPEFWKKQASEHPNAVFLLWLGPADLASIESLYTAGDSKPSALMISYSMIGRDLTVIPDTLRDAALITFPNRLPLELEYSTTVVKSWLQYKNIETSNLDISSKTYLLTRILSTVLVDIAADLYRDYFMELIDDGRDQTNTSITYPLLSFGPGQRYASKGCYVVTATKGPVPMIVKQSDWVIY